MGKARHDNGRHIGPRLSQNLFHFRRLLDQMREIFFAARYEKRRGWLFDVQHWAGGLVRAVAFRTKKAWACA
jgi:hypothetical protein